MYLSTLPVAEDSMVDVCTIIFVVTIGCGCFDNKQLRCAEGMNGCTCANVRAVAAVLPPPLLLLLLLPLLPPLLAPLTQLPDAFPVSIGVIGERPKAQPLLSGCQVANSRLHYVTSSIVTYSVLTAP